MTTYTGHLVIRLSNGKAQNVFLKDGSLVQPSGTYELDLVQSFTDAAVKAGSKTSKDDKELVKAVLEANGGTQFYRFRLTHEGIADSYTTDVEVYPDKQAGATNAKEFGKRQKYDYSLLEYVLENRGQDLMKVEPKQREEAGPVTRTPANADNVEAILREAKEDLDKGELTKAEYYQIRAALASN
jgi:hypothetical protein